MDVRIAAKRLFPYAVAATCGFLSVAPLIFARGIPAYQHDWSWPFTPQAVWSGLVGHFSLWEQSGLGRPNPLASANPLLVILSGFGLLFGPIAGAKIAIVCAALLAALAATYCALRTVCAQPFAATLAGILYVTSPVLFNKIAAGQVTFWYAYALLPLIFERARAARSGNWRAALWTALLCALATIQPQFAVFSLIVVFVAAFSLRNGRATAIALGAAIIGIGVALAPTVWALFSARGDVLAQFPWPVQTWERAHSAPLSLALLTSHYIIPYYDTALHSNLSFVQAAAAAGIFGIILAIRRRDGIPLLILVLAGLCFTTGTAGPLQSFWSWMFSHVEATASFRELYNANALIGLAYALGVAAAAREAPVGKLVAAALVTFSAVPILLGTLGAVVHNVINDDVSYSDAIAARPPGRILYLPSLTPLVRNGHEPGGVDVLASGDRMHWPASEYPTQFPLTTVSAGAITDPWWRRLVRNLGVSGMVMRPNLHSESNLNTPGTHAAPAWAFEATDGRPLVEIAPRPQMQSGSFRASLGDDVQLADATGILPETPGVARVILPAPSLLTDDPAQDWVPLDRWRNVAPDAANSFKDGVVTTSRATLAVALPAGRWWLFAAADAPLEIVDASGQRRVAANGRTWIPLNANGNAVRIRATVGRAAVYRLASGTSSIPRGPFARGVAISAARPWPWIATIDFKRTPSLPVLLIFRDRFSEAWRINGAQTLWHGVADGYANAFLIAGPARTISIVYQPQSLFLVLAALSALAYVLAVSALIRSSIA